jgi:hypothetical protein
MLSSIRIAAFLFWIAAILLVIQPIAFIGVMQDCQSAGKCCPGCEDEGGRNTDQSPESTCSCISSVTLHMTVEGSSYIYNTQTGSTPLFDTDMPLQSLTCSIFHPPIAI